MYVVTKGFGFMGWKIDKRSAKFGHLGVAAQALWDRFQNGVHQGQHPMAAARQAGDTNPKVLSGSKIQQYQIRLSYSDRATFLVDDITQTVTVLQVGGHT